MAKKTGKLLVLTDERELEIIGETGRYYICNGCQFKKSSNQIKEIKKAPKKVNQEHIYEPDEHSESGLLEVD